MGVIPTRTDVISIVCVIAFPTAGTGLTCISWIDIYNFNPCKGSLVFNEFCQTIEAPIMEAVIVFTACSCRLADTGKLLQFDGFYTARSRVIHDGAAYLMVLVCHPTLFFIARFFNGFQLFRFAEFFALRSKFVLWCNKCVCSVYGLEKQPQPLFKYYDSGIYTNGNWLYI